MKSSQNGIMFGVYSIEPPKNGLPSGWLGVETLLGKKLPAVLLYAHFTETGSSTLTTFQNSVGQFMDRDFNLGKRRNWQVGLEPITLDLFEPSPENPSVKVVIPNNQKSRVNEVIQGAWDQWYINWFTSAVNKAKQQNCIIYIRFASEMNGTWTSWSANKNMPNGSSKFLQMWQHVYNIARQQNIDPDKKYLKFVWAPMIGGLSENFYPGDNFVDWVGLSVYNDNGNFNDTYTHLKLFHDYYGLSKNKPMMITESGYWIDGGNLPVAVNWTRSLVEAVKDTDTFSMLKAFFWFDCINFRFETHPEMLEIFTNAINSPLFVADPINY